jgi:hypothetical protein
VTPLIYLRFTFFYKIKNARVLGCKGIGQWQFWPSSQSCQKRQNHPKGICHQANQDELTQLQRKR